MNESAYTALVVRRLRAERAFVWKTHGHAMQTAGMPDLYIASPAFHGWVELKVGRNTLTPLQTLIRGRLAAQGVPVIVLRGPEHQVTWADGSEATLAWDQSVLSQLARTNPPLNQPTTTASVLP